MCGRFGHRLLCFTGMVLVLVLTGRGERVGAIPLKLRTMIQQAMPEEVIEPVKRARRVLVCGALTDDPDDVMHVIGAERACRVAKGVGGYRGLQMVVMLGKSDEQGVWDAMEDALIHWPNATGSKAAMALIEQEKMPVDRKKLLEVFVRMIGELEESPAKFRSSALAKALEISEWDGIDVQVFLALAYIDDFSSIDVVLKVLNEKSYFNVKTVREAARALVVVTEKIGNENIGKGEDALNKAIEILSAQGDDDMAGELLVRAKNALAELEN